MIVDMAMVMGVGVGILMDRISSIILIYVGFLEDPYNI